MPDATRRVAVGTAAIGGGAAITVQSMTNTPTADAEATLAQIEALAGAGCDIVRFAVNDMAAADAVRLIRAGTKTPLVADIHFDYRLAIACAENGVDKLRINPGNIGSEQRVRALADAARAHRIPIRIGVNSGSLERELLARYGGATPEAMCESALGHVRLLEKAGFEDIVISAKSSSVRDTVEAYRLISKHTNYPLHLGVTEAGGGAMSLAKSNAGIGALLLEGIGDTVRFSISGDPVREAEAGITLLRALGIRREGMELISCPTCGRCRNIAAHAALCERAEREFKGERRPIKLAVMGCAVNGPGEAKAADIGIALGRTNAVIFAKGAQVTAGELPQIEETFFTMARAVLAGEE